MNSKQRINRNADKCEESERQVAVIKTGKYVGSDITFLKWYSLIILIPSSGLFILRDSWDCKKLLESFDAILISRQQFGAEYGCCDQVDVEVLLLAYCRNHQSSCWAVLGSDKALTLSCNQLRQSNMQMATIFRTMAPETLILRSSRVSSASESYRS
uniref:PINc domain-containing protein n=1 Tax=Elaeophora elaphi TaxID=1147741 RepID=A0A0R3RJJ6_9BILA